ncbi:DNA alkylation repair protein [Alkalihalobacillus oceani]|uniref:DNA alkylation repair protein n=1 Tax=Halalkalibacter oceani TaxID=1653776 RepID=UPI00203F2FE2|nr:DNA alkylation repair protein [Halalkalibacter oceani]MCM3760875.1 DNA alkylation repair protein [Halalkalibacter oceani]
MNDYYAHDFIKELEKQRNEQNVEKMKRFFKSSDPDTLCLGLNMRTVFQLAKQFIGMPLSEIEKVLESPYYEVRMGAVSIMDYQAKQKKLSNDERKALFDLYIRRHERINNWDFVDRSAPSVVGIYLLDKPRDILYKLARSNNLWERRTAIVSTYAFIKKGEIEDTFKIAELLINDQEELIQKAVGSWTREAGKKDHHALKRFLDKHAATMPRVTLRYAIEKFDKETRDYYLALAK